MTSNTPTPCPDDPDSTTKPSQPLAAELLTTGTVPATTAATASTSPKLPPFRGD
jgi:hypothetical protein